MKKFQNQISEQPSIDIDFHEDFPPLPKSVKPDQSPTLKKIAQASTTAKVSPLLLDSDIPNPFETLNIASRPQSSGSLEGAITPLRPNTSRDVDNDMSSHRSSVQGTPAFPRAPPPSSAELSTAGNTAPTTPTVAYVRPRITAQSLHDRLLHANATLATLQEGRPLALSRSVPISPLLSPTMTLGDLARKWMVEEPEEMDEVVESLDTTVRGISVEAHEGDKWTARGSLIQA